MSVEGDGWGGVEGGADEGKEVVEEGGPLVHVGAEEDEGEGVGELVSEDWGRGDEEGAGEETGGGVQVASASAGPLTYSEWT